MSDLATITAVLIGGAFDGEQIEVHPHAQTAEVHKYGMTDFKLTVNKLIYYKQDPPASSPVKFYLQPPWINKTHHG